MPVSKKDESGQIREYCSPIQKFIIFIVFTILTFCPVSYIEGVRIPTIIFLLPVALLCGKFPFDKAKICFFALSTASASLLAMLAYLVFGNFVAKDFFYPFIPIIMLVGYFIFCNLISNKAAASFAIKCAQAFLIIQLIFVVLERTNLFNFNQLFFPAFSYWVQANAGGGANMFEVAYRPFGTMGNPVVLAVVAGIMGRIIQAYTSKKIYHYIAFLIICLSSAVMPMVAFLAIEVFDLFFVQIKKNPKRTVLVAIAFVAFIAISFSVSPYIRTRAMSIFSTNTTSDYSVSYRLGMLDYLKQYPQYMAIGGMSIDSMPAYVDCELVLRLLQFGILGFSMLLAPYLYMFIDAAKNDTNRTSQHLFAFLAFCMLTSTIFTNVFYTIFLALFFAIGINYRPAQAKNLPMRKGI